MNRARLAEAFRRTYLRIDPRSLALGRIAIGLVLIADLLRRIPWLRDFYSNAGLIPNQPQMVAAGPAPGLKISDQIRPMTVTPSTVGRKMTAR